MQSRDRETLELLRLHNLVVVEVPRDGNCLFHSLCFFYNDPTMSAKDLRLRLCNYIFRNSEHFQTAVADSKEFPSLQQYLLHMQREGVYGDGTIIDAFSMFFQINVVIFNDGQFYETLPNSLINVALYWDRRSQHYQPAVPQTAYQRLKGWFT